MQQVDDRSEDDNGTKRSKGGGKGEQKEADMEVLTQSWR